MLYKFSSLAVRWEKLVGNNFRADSTFNLDCENLSSYLNLAISRRLNVESNRSNRDTIFIQRVYMYAGRVLMFRLSNHIVEFLSSIVSVLVTER